ncbi:MAG: T9SS type A sorting domain-containing protein, partial [Ferruginibacter sp.]
NNGALSLKSGTTVNGRAMTTSGALSTDASIVTSPSGDCNLLPVTWLYFRGMPVQKNVLLEWGTTNEVNNGFFTIEKSTDGQKFATLTTVSVTKQVETTGHQYSFTDQQPYSLGLYRISQTDKDGQKQYYKTIQVKLNLNLGLTVRPYVRENYVYVETSGAVPGDGSLVLYNVEGKKMSSQKIILTKEVSSYKINTSLHKGLYLLYIESHGKKLYTGKVMVL